MGGQATMTGAVRLSDGARLKLAGRVNNLPLQCVPGIAGVTASGLADVTFAINGPSSSPVVTAGFNVGSGRVDKTRFSSASGEVTYTGNTVHVSRITVLDVFGGRVQARGSLSKSRIGIELAAEGIDLASAGKMARRPDIGGVGYFRGRVSGLLSNPGVTGVLEVFDGRYGKYQIDYLRAAVASDGRRVRVAAGTARLFPAELNFSGILQGLGTDRINVSAKGHVERLTVQQLAELLGRDYSASGAVVGDIQIDGVYARRSERPLSGLVASADLRVEDGMVFGYPISSAKAVAELRDGILTIPELSIVTQEAKLGVAGVYSLDTRAVEGNIHLSDLNLARISDRINAYVTLTGIASAQGTISGLLDAPSLSVGGKITGFTVNGISLDDAYWQADYFDGVVKSVEVGLRRGQQLYSLRVADYNIASNCLTAAVGVVRDALVPDLWDVLIRSPFLGTPEGAGLRQSLSRIPRLTSGVANCSIELRGCLANPDGLLSLTAENVGFDVQKVQRVELVASTKDGVVVLDKALASSGETSLIAVGNPLYANGNVQLDVSAQNLDLQRLRPWLGENTPSGLSSAEFSVTGDVRQPKVVGSIEVVNPSLHGAGFDRLRASRIEVKTDRVEFSDIILAVGKHQAVAQGYLPWDWSNYSVPEDKPLEFSARLNKQDLSIIGKFWKLVETVRTTGDIEAQLDVQGTLAAPSMSGSFKVNKGTVALRGLTSDLTNIDVDIAFDGDKILVNQFTAQSSGGGSLVVQQGSYVTIGNPGEFDVMVSASGLTVSEKNLLGFQEDVVLRVDAGLAIKGPLRSPIVADALGGVPGLLIYDSRLAFLVPEAMPERKQTAFEINPSFNVSIKIGRDVIVAPPNVSLRVAGGGDLTGTLNSPVLKLAMRVDEGSIRLAASRLHVVPGGQIVATYAPPAEPEIRVDFTATSYVTALGPFNRRERYEIILGVSGLAKNMQISLTSKPGGLSREQMLASLGHIEGVFTSGEEGLKQELGNLLTAVGASTLFAPIEALFVERLGFEQFTLEYSSISPLSLFFSTKLFGNFYMSYYQQLLASYANVKDAAWEFRFGYRFKRFYSISVGFTSQEVTDVEIGLVRAFN
jgi:translocation and assembly module TamB